MSFTKKLLGLVFLLEMFLVALAGLNYRTMNGVVAANEHLASDNVKTLDTVLDLNVAMLSARRYEKDFLLRKQLKYIKANDKAVARMKEDIRSLARLQSQDENAPLDSEAEQLLKDTTEYSVQFHKVTAAYLRKGGTDEGIIGEFRTSVHALEALFKAAKLGHFTAELLMLRRHEKDYLLRGLDKYVAKVSKQVQRLHTLIGKTEAANISPATRKKVDALLEDYHAGFRAVVEIDEEIKSITEGFRASVHKIEPKISAARSKVEAKIVNLRAAAKQETDAAVKLTVIASLLFIIIGIVVGLLVARQIGRQIAHVSHSLRDIADGEGDLSQELVVRSKDEIGDLAHWFNVFVSHMRGIIGDVRTTADQIAMGSSQVSDSGQALAQGSTDSAASIAQIIISLEKLSGQTKINSDNACEANGLSSEVSREAERGARHMEEMVVAVADINESSKSISKIIRTIDEIAFQTNLLALNAAVEAARAGSHGKGFAVVAEEVRSLAARSSKAAVETSHLIEESIKKAGRGAEITNMTSQSLTSIVDGISKVSSIVDDITNASALQSEDLSNLSDSVHQIDNVIQRNTASSEESAAASEDLAMQASHLKAMMARFVLEPQESKKATPTPKNISTGFDLDENDYGEVDDSFGGAHNAGDIISLDDDGGFGF